MKGPSVEAYVKHIQKLYNLSKPSSHFIIDKESAILEDLMLSVHVCLLFCHVNDDL